MELYKREYELRMRDTVKIINETRENRYSLHDTYMRFHTVARGMKQRQKGIPSFTVMAGVVARVYLHTSPSPREDRAQRDDTDMGFLLA
ncbi:hypothetical protein DBV15_01818 [Temnothorax longispinosus]|uniref:Uncharacterized protein n=1 Tax=Temnothorax longispinosus TaxID=300112 RepID=A0A4V3SBQ9_9HYME|nr:hypothetical protein DBV15_01818 [Temnothorax longispinosus]